MCAFSLLQSNKENPDLSWEFSPQLFLKTEFPPTPYAESFCLLVTVNGNPSRIHDYVSLKGAAGPRGQPVSIPSLAIAPSPNPFPLACTELLHLLRPFLSLFFHRDPQDKKEKR